MKKQKFFSLKNASALLCGCLVLTATMTGCTQKVRQQVKTTTTAGGTETVYSTVEEEVTVLDRQKKTTLEELLEEWDEETETTGTETVRASSKKKTSRIAPSKKKERKSDDSSDTSSEDPGTEPAEDLTGYDWDAFSFTPSADDRPAYTADSGFTLTLTPTAPANGATGIAVANEMVAAFYGEKYTLAAADKYFTLESERYYPAEIRFAWTGNGATALLLAEKPDFSDAVFYAVSGNEAILSGLKSKTTYYWKLNGSGVKSAVWSFTTGAGPRTVYIDGVTNTRDIGGFATTDGKKILQGKVYRTGHLDDITPAGIDYCLNVLGIRTEIDLRREDEGHVKDGVKCSPLGNSVRYINISSPYYAGDGSIFNPANAEAMRQIMEVFADPDNYPIVFHCAIGRDRTGSVGFLLETICGMEVEDIFRDYDLSTFSKNGDHAPSVLKDNFFLPMVKKMNGYDRYDLFTNTAKYLLDIGLTKEQIAAIRFNLRENG